jgi:hypothetical protein
MHDYNSVIKKFKDTSNIIKEYGYQEASKSLFYIDININL